MKKFYLKIFFALCMCYIGAFDSFATVYPQDWKYIGPAIRTIYYKQKITSSETARNLQISIESDKEDTKNYYVLNNTEYLIGRDVGVSRTETCTSSNVTLHEQDRSVLGSNGYGWRSWTFTISGSISGTNLTKYTISADKNTINLYLLRFKYELVYNANGGSGTVPSKWKSGWTDSGCSPANLTGLDVPWNLGDDISYSTTHPLDYADGGLLTKTGYTHDGWSTSQTGSKITGGSATISGTGHSHINNDSNPVSTTVYAHWTPISYTATFDNNGGNGQTSATFNIEQSLSLPTPTKPGYTFAGWKITSASGNWSNGTTYTSGSVSKGQYGNVTFTALWTANSYTATYSFNGGSGSPASSSFKTGEAVSLPSATRDGYAFNGWKVTTAAGNWTSGETYTGNSVPSGKYGNVTFTAQWSANQYKVTGSISNGSVTNGSQTVNHGSSSAAMNFSASTNYVITNVTENGTAIFNVTTTAQALSSTSYSYGARTITASKAVVATTASKYDVSFNGNGATSGSMSQQSFVYGYAQNLTANAFSRKFKVSYDANYSGAATIDPSYADAKFDKWGTTTSGGTTYENGASVNNLTTTAGGTVPLYAQWVPDGSVTLPSASKVGYVFEGWYTAATGGTLVGNAGDSYKPSSDITLYAHYRIGLVSLTIKETGLGSGESAVITVTAAGQSLPLYTVSVGGDRTSVTITGLTAGTYTIASTGWSHAYTIDAASVEKEIMANTTVTFNFTEKTDTPSHAEGSLNNWAN